MLDELKKTINAILYDRIANPLSSSILFSWCIWNWRIIYTTLFVDSGDIPAGLTKLEYIEANYIDINLWLWYPLLSAFILITIYPFLTEGAYRLWLFFRKRKNKWKEKFDNQKLLTVEQSLALKLQIRNQIDTFDKLTSDKDLEIKSLKAEIENLNNANSLPQASPQELENATKDGNNPINEESMEILEELMNTKVFITKDMDNEYLQKIYQLEHLGAVDITESRAILTQAGREIVDEHLAKRNSEIERLSEKYKDLPDFAFFKQKPDLKNASFKNLL